MGRHIPWLHESATVETRSRVQDKEANASKNEEAFAELIQFLDEKSLALVAAVVGKGNRICFNCTQQGHIACFCPNKPKGGKWSNACHPRSRSDQAYRHKRKQDDKVNHVSDIEHYFFRLMHWPGILCCVHVQDT